MGLWTHNGTMPYAIDESKSQEQSQLKTWGNLLHLFIEKAQNIQAVFFCLPNYFIPILLPNLMTKDTFPVIMQRQKFQTFRPPPKPGRGKFFALAAYPIFNVNKSMFMSLTCVPVFTACKVFFWFS